MVVGHKNKKQKGNHAICKETGVSHAEAERLFGDWLKKGGKPRKNMLEQVDKASRKNMKKMMKSPDYGKKFTFSKKLKKMVGLE